MLTGTLPVCSGNHQVVTNLIFTTPGTADLPPTRCLPLVRGQHDMITCVFHLRIIASVEEEHAANKTHSGRENQNVDTGMLQCEYCLLLQIVVDRKMFKSDCSKAILLSALILELGALSDFNHIVKHDGAFQACLCCRS